MARDKDRYSRDQRFEVVLDNGEDYTKWLAADSADNVVSGTLHITGSQSIGFDKVNTGAPSASVYRYIQKNDGTDLDAFSSEGQFLSSVYLPSVADVDSFKLTLMSADGSDSTFYSVSGTELSSGWNHLKMDCNDYAGYSNNMADWKHIQIIQATVEFNNVSDTLAGMFLDSIRVQMPTATVNFDPNIANVTVGSSMTITDGTDDLDLLRADAAPTVATITVPIKPVDEQGNVITGGGGTSGGLTLYTSPVHFTAVYQSATSLDLSGMSFSITDFSQFVEIEAWDASAGFIAKYSPKTHVFAWDNTSSRVTVTGAAFVTGGTYKVSILAADRTISLPDDAVKTLVGNHYPLVSDDSGVTLISSAQNVTDSGWVDLGPEISTFGYNSLGLWLSIISNDSYDIYIRALAKHASAGSDEYPLVVESLSSTGAVTNVVPNYWQFDNVDGNYVLAVNTNGIVPYVQLQVASRVQGATQGQISAASYTRGWR